MVYVKNGCVWVLVAALGAATLAAAGEPFVVSNQNKPASVKGKILYADSKLEADITDGTYSAATRDLGGHDGNAYATVQEAIHHMEPGDVLLLRGGVFKERDIRLIKAGPGNKIIKGRADAWLTIRSYPGEWAVVDGEHHEEWDEKADRPKTFSVFRTSGAGERHVTFWRFAWFEVRGGGPALTDKDGKKRTYEDIHSLSGKGFHFWPGKDLEFDHMVIHDNYGGGGPNGGAGISIQGEAYDAQRVKIHHCWLKGNGWPGGKSGNLSNIVFFADYKWRKFPDYETQKSLSANDVSYNLLEDSVVGFKHKGTQYLCMKHDGSDMSAKDRGSQVHHNVIRGCKVGIKISMDFMQVHHNIVEQCWMIGILFNDMPSHGYRELFYNVCYNNTVLDCRIALGFYKGWGSGACNYLTPPYRGHFYAFNNILHSNQNRTTAENGPFLLYPRYTKEAPVDMKALHLEANLILGRAADGDAIRVGMHNHSVAAFLDQGWSKAAWAVQDPASVMGKDGASRFCPRDDYALPNGKSWKEAGRGGKHPYRKGIEIPSYLGAVGPGNDGWVTAVENLKNLGTTLKAPPLE